MRPNARSLLVTVTIGAVALGACGSSSKSASRSAAKAASGAATASTAPAPVSLAGTATDHGHKDLTAKGASPSLEVEAYDFYFEPTYVKVAPGATVSVELKNSGKMQHTFTVDGQVDQTLDPGAKAEVQVHAPADGVLRYYCRFHSGSGMQGAIYVRGTGSSAASAATTASPVRTTATTTATRAGY
ncbi:MAG: cupredoxin domain-containing protein [Acidimicrobiia bacterium]